MSKWTIVITDDDEEWVSGFIGDWRKNLEESLHVGDTSAAKTMQASLLGAEMAFASLGLADFARLARAAHNDPAQEATK